MSTPPVVRPATPADTPAILSLVLGLAAYEKLDPPDAAAQERLIRDALSLLSGQ